jgi:enolase-phosphatase E1
MIRAILTDIEGTTSSLSFVKDVLFPYARAHLPDFVRAHASEPEVRASLDEALALMGEPNANNERVIAQLLQWIDEDRKITPLKALQGSVWKRGYAAGDFSGHIYEDATAALKAWHARGIALYVYSSGSVPAQKLLFAHTPAGDLTPLFSGYYDTRIGAKVDAGSYRRIAADIGFKPDEVLFLSDIQRELNAAREAGMQTWQLVREGEFDANARHRQARDFAAITV